MSKSGLSTLLLLVLTVVIVLLAASGTPGGLRGLWDRVIGDPAPNPPEQHILDARRPLGAQDGMRQVDRMQRDMARMDSLAGSVRDR